MDAATVFRIISLIPDRVARSQSGCAFNPEGRSEKIALMVSFLHWLGPLEALTKEQQQFLGLRSNGGKAVEEELEPLEADEADETEELPTTPQPGTQIAVQTSA